MILIDHGHVVFDGAVEAIRRELGGERRLRVDFDGAAPDELPDDVEVEERAPRSAWCCASAATGSPRRG